jgi:DNA-binding NarL/FixJ family response regulator
VPPKIIQQDIKMIYLVSDDSFFTLGAEAFFSTENKNVTVIDVNIEKERLSTLNFTGEDILLIAIEQADIITALLAIARMHGAKVLLVMDNASDKTLNNINQWSQGVLAKKMPLNDLLNLLEADFTYLKDLSFLTRQEIKIMQELTTGKTPHNISRELNLSVKTICGHKVNALRKLGLNHLNARSVMIFGKICRGLSYF